MIRYSSIEAGRRGGLRRDDRGIHSFSGFLEVVADTPQDVLCRVKDFLGQQWRWLEIHLRRQRWRPCFNLVDNRWCEI